MELSQKQHQMIIKILYIIKCFFIYCLYFLVTIKKRELYFISRTYNKNCTKSEIKNRFLYTDHIYSFDNKEIKRDYLNWSEYWKLKFKEYNDKNINNKR